MNVSSLRFSELSPARQHLFRICQELGYGAIEDLILRGGQPEFAERSPRLIANRKLDGESPTTRIGDGGDFDLCNEFDV